MSNHPIIKALQEELAKERNELSLLELGDHCFPFLRGHEAASARLLSLLEKAVEVIEQYADGRAFDFIGIRKGQVSFDRALSSATAKQFLTTLADASGEGKHES